MARRRLHSSLSSWLPAHLRHLILNQALLLLACQCSKGEPLAYQLSEEWQGWKLEHGKGYETEKEEIYRHIIWQSNKKFIEIHNLYNKSFGYTLAMNEMGDLVGILHTIESLKYTTSCYFSLRFQLLV